MAPERIDTHSVLSVDSVGSVHKATIAERLVDKLPTAQTAVALFGVIAAFTVCVCVLFSDKPALQNFHTGAWSVISGIAGACITYFFGGINKPE